MIRDALLLLSEGRDLSEDQASACLREVLQGAASPAQIGALLMGLRRKGETTEEVAGFVQAMREAAVRLPADLGDDLVDTCGTGGDGASTFNISTAAAFVAAGAGARVAKHGNRSVSSRCGSADVLEALGVRVECSPEQAARCLREAGMAFLYAPAYHPALRHASAPRRELGFRSVFNFLGPLCNPARPAYQVMGVFDRGLLDRAARILARVGVRRALVVHGASGLDEATTVGVTHAIDVRAGERVAMTIDPAELGLPAVGLEALRGGDAVENAEILLRILGGEKGPRRDTVALSAALALWVCGRAADPRAALTLAFESLDSGKALAALNRLREVSHA
ncbi:MAG: anthranilate phosphoribosyltransferase [Planctomycetes bacterium]|nr:anthranilate phosphoribosyltransferase [Planctomycetota bacterium]